MEEYGSTSYTFTYTIFSLSVLHMAIALVAFARGMEIDAEDLGVFSLSNSNCLSSTPLFTICYLVIFNQR